MNVTRRFVVDSLGHDTLIRGEPQRGTDWLRYVNQTTTRQGDQWMGICYRALGLRRTRVWLSEQLNMTRIGQLVVLVVRKYRYHRPGDDGVTEGVVGGKGL